MSEIARLVEISPDAKLVVDGELFPWAYREVTVHQYLPDLYEVKVVILDATPFTCSGFGDSPVIRGITFPWELSRGIRWEIPEEGSASIELGFYAQDVANFTHIQVHPAAT